MLQTCRYSLPRPLQAQKMRVRACLVLLAVLYGTVTAETSNNKDIVDFERDGNTSAAVRLARSTRNLQVLDEQARIFMVPDFLSEEECDHLVALAEPALTRSGVVKTTSNGTGASAVHQIRTSSGAFLERGQDDVIKRIEERIALWTLMPAANGESMQVLRYNDGEKYEAHFDYFFDNSSISNGGNRYATVLMYLSDAEEGGETVFPIIASDNEGSGISDCAVGKLAVKPEKGTAILFHSQDATGSLERRSLHASCPVLSGTKWTAVKWIRTGRYMTKSELTAMLQQLALQQRQLQTVQRLQQALQIVAARQSQQ